MIVRHHRELHRSSNSGRLAHLALPNSEIIEHGGPGGSAVLPDLDGAWLVYPVGEPTVVAPVVPPKQLVVLDATWSQARRMYRKLDVRRLPILRLPDDAMATARMRASPGPGQVSTLEAIAGALGLVENPEIATQLQRLFAVAVEHARASGRRGDS